MKLNEHPSCGCHMCRLGRGTSHGQFVHKQTQRRLRRKTKEELTAIVRGQRDDIETLQAATPYTD